MIPVLKERARRRPSPAERRLGYVATVVVYAVLIYVVNRLLDWEWPSFLTEDFSIVLPWLRASLIVGIVVNAVYVVSDPRRLRSLGQLVENVFSMVVTVRFLQVFPFDFSAWQTDWSWLVRTILWIALIGVLIASVVELAKLGRRAASTPNDPR